ncbi:hypothetical protein [Nocardiopsis sp. FR4]|uniref:hypothetical protein n=1 Tax=Nocardiopsis sp. FR4 TaxID=2605985 RepID=UPI00135C8D22|nr:hypothetical protein [Nocardiopsis sp. FR4]
MRIRFPGTPVRVGETWRHCNPRDKIVVRVTKLSDTRIEVVDAATGKRPRSLLRHSFHASPVTHTGAQRKTGYVQVSAAPLPTPEERIRDAIQLVREAKTATSVDLDKLLADLDEALLPLPF